MNKLQEMKSGVLEGGFISIKGGLNKNTLSTNSAAGPSGCTDYIDCTRSTNTSISPCANTTICFM
ncbi:hypothetical protein [Rhizosphaericola mali]|uniref:Uncharacterized protein n=1 Tax=Rhizosphaericola mali TaxID=2545455 RepID=A0A5P2G6W3_9BACT|nr:hypothetical protein [Rhizosphaericola mali]QES91067.1 hypothetical protein E0W69_020350 [Rhizosphaericola mali]